MFLHLFDNLAESTVAVAEQRRTATQWKKNLQMDLRFATCMYLMQLALGILKKFSK